MANNDSRIEAKRAIPSGQRFPLCDAIYTFSRSRIRGTAHVPSPPLVRDNFQIAGLISKELTMSNVGGV